MFPLDEVASDPSLAASHVIPRGRREPVETRAAVTAVPYAAERAADHAHRVVRVDRGHIVVRLPAAEAQYGGVAVSGMGAGAGPGLLLRA